MFPNSSRPHIIPMNLTSVDMAYVLISNITAFTSFAGCLVIISSYAAYKEIRTTSRLLLVFLSVSDVLVGGATLLQTGSYYKSPLFPNERSFACQGAAGLLVYAQVCCALWTVAITCYLFLCVSGHCITVANRIVFLFHVFCWLMPLVVSMAADISGVFGYDSGDILRHQHPTTCWISDRVVNPLPWYMITVEGWVLATFVLVCLLYIPISLSIYCKKTEGKVMVEDDVIEELAVQTANEQLRFIPAIYVCTRIWGTAYFLFTRYPVDSPLRGYDWLLIIKAFGDNSQGLVNAIFFCLATKQIRKIIAKRIRTCCACFSGWCRQHRIIGEERWIRVPSIVRMQARMPRRSRNMDGSDLDISGISFELPPPEADLGVGEDDILFER